MQKNTMSKDGTLQVRRPLLLGLVGVGFTVSLMLVLSILISSRILPEGREGLLSRCCLFAGSLLAGLLAARKAKTKRAASSLLSGAVLFVAVMLAGVLNKRCSVFNMSLLIDLAVILAGSLLGSITSAKRRGKRRRR